MIRIENKKTYRGEGVYIGRPSPLGNPFKIGEHGTREEVIQCYRAWLWQQIKLQGVVYQELERLAARAKNEDLVLICWCKPANCHGDVIKSAVEWVNRQDSSTASAQTGRHS
jgi:hypothetical protein